MLNAEGIGGIGGEWLSLLAGVGFGEMGKGCTEAREAEGDREGGGEFDSGGGEPGGAVG
jgi:hypothetical protein